jgi:hypothetical protein
MQKHRHETALERFPPLHFQHIPSPAYSIMFSQYSILPTEMASNVSADYRPGSVGTGRKRGWIESGTDRFVIA